MCSRNSEFFERAQALNDFELEVLVFFNHIEEGNDSRVWQRVSGSLLFQPRQLVKGSISSEL